MPIISSEIKDRTYKYIRMKRSYANGLIPHLLIHENKCCYIIDVKISFILEK